MDRWTKIQTRTDRQTDRQTDGRPLELATLQGCSTASSSGMGVAEVFSAAVKRRMLGYLSAIASSSLALNTCGGEEERVEGRGEGRE